MPGIYAAYLPECIGGRGFYMFDFTTNAVA